MIEGMKTMEILFKAKNIEDGNWVFGSYLTFPNAQNGGIEHRIIDKYGYVFIVDSETVCQYIGLTDKHGVKIFEGDFIRVCLDPGIEVGKVVYDSKIAAFIIAFEDAFSTFLDFEIARKKVGDKVWVEVINNTMEEDNYEI